MNNCINADFEELVEGMPSCLLWDDEPHKCIGWLREDLCCIDYEDVEFLTLIRIK